MDPELNTRILVVDDEELVRDSVREILCPRRPDYSDLNAAALLLFDDGGLAAPRRPIETLQIELHEAQNGRVAVDLVRRAVADGRPFALILLDMRMPGWDGLATAQAIRKIDQKVEIVFVTAHSDHAIQEVVERVGPDVGYLCKPFAAEEIQQLAIKAIYDWNRLRNLENLISILSGLRVGGGHLETLQQNIFDQATSWIGARSAMLLSLENQAEPRICYCIGSLCQSELARSCVELVQPLLGTTEFGRVNDLAYFPFDQWALVVYEEGGFPLSTERLYLFRLFLEHSGQALQNARLHEALLAREKLSAVGQALNIVVHDLRSPIGIIVNSAQLAKEEPGTPAPVIEYLDMIVQATDNAMAIVNDVLDFTRNSKLDKIPCQVDELLRQLREGTRAHTDVRLELTGTAAERLACDPRKLHRALLNLVNNAAEALTAARTPDPLVQVNASSENGAVVFRVRDNGPGIPESIRHKLFEPFTTFGKATGTGLGLAIVRQIVEAHGGSIDVETSPQGTTFLLAIPRGLD